jgi:soluble lytic murein transglycosylase-like protein
MTKRLFATTLSPHLARRWEQRRNAAAAAAVLGMALLTLLASSAIQRPAVAGAAELIPAPASVLDASGDPAADHALLADLKPPPGLVRREREIENLASIVSRRYRVSRDATQLVVGAAYRAGIRSGVDPLLVVAVIAVESRFNPIAQSDGGALGLMQIIPHYHADKFDAKTGSVLDPETNIQLGVSVLKDYIKRGGTEIAGLQLYNGALGDVANSYATRVLAEKQRLQDALRREREHDRV